MIPFGRFAVGAQQAFPLAAAAFVIGVLTGLRNGHMQLPRQILDRLRKGKPFHLLNELNDVSPGLAAEAIIQILFRVDRKGRRLFMMEGTQAPVSGTVFFQGGVSRYDLNDVRA